MDQENKKEAENKKENNKENWIDKAEKIIDETTEKIHKSDAYKKADQSMEKAAKKIFRKAGRWWGKTERYIKKQSEDNQDES